MGVLLRTSPNEIAAHTPTIVIEYRYADLYHSFMVIHSSVGEETRIAPGATTAAQLVSSRVKHGSLPRYRVELALFTRCQP